MTLRIPRPALAVALSLLAGCGVLGGGADLTAVEVAGRYEFTELRLDPVSDAVDDVDLRDDRLPDDMTLLIREDGTARLERLQSGDVVGRGSYTLSGDRLRVRLDRGFPEAFLPAEIEFEAGDERLSADIPYDDVDLGEISDDFEGVERADVVVRVRLREIG